MNKQKIITNLKGEINKDNAQNDFNINNNLNNYSSNTGVIDYHFKRKGYCVNKYDNNDEYFGYYSDDLRNNHGFYTYNPISISNRNSLFRYYFGQWKNDLRDGKGIYLWSYKKNYRKDFDKFDNSNFKAYIGYFEKDNLNKGTYLSKEANEYFVYHGSFSLDNKREGDNCFYFSNSLEQLLYGTFKDNQFISGYVAKFNEDGEIIKFMEYRSGKLNDKNNSDLLCENAREIMFNFRNAIMGKDYFGIVYDVFNKVREFKEKYLYDIDRMNDDKFQDFVKLCDSYKSVTIYEDIEKAINI